MENNELKVGDRVAIRQFSSTIGVDTVCEITKGGNIRLAHSNSLYTPSGSLRGGGSWTTHHIHKITEEKYNEWFLLQQLKEYRRDIKNYLTELTDSDLLANADFIKSIYEKLKKD